MTTIKLCLDCDHEIEVEHQLTVGQRIICPNCGVELEIIKLEPLEFDWVYDGPKKNLGQFNDWWKASVQK